MSQEAVTHGGAVYGGGLQRTALTRQRRRHLGGGAPFLSTGQMAMLHSLCLMSHAAGVGDAEGPSACQDGKGTDAFQNKSPEVRSARRH